MVRFFNKETAELIEILCLFAVFNESNQKILRKLLLKVYGSVSGLSTVNPPQISFSFTVN